MLQLTGKTLDCETEERQGPTGPFVSTTITVLVEAGAQTQVYRVRAGRDLRSVDYPKKDEQVTLNVLSSAYSGKNGPGVQLTATSRVHSKSHASV